MTDKTKLKEMDRMTKHMRSLLPTESHLLVKWGASVKDEPVPKAEKSNHCPICQGKIYIA